MPARDRQAETTGQRLASGRRGSLLTDRQILFRYGQPEGRERSDPVIIVRPIDARPLLTTGNGTVNVDWLAGEPGQAAVVSHPHFGWFSSAHKRHVRVGTWRLRVICDGRQAWFAGTRSWYTLSAVPNTHARLVADEAGEPLSLCATGICPPGEDAWVMQIQVENEGRNPHSVGLVFEGNLCVGDEAWYSRGETLAYPGSQSKPLPPAKVTCRPTRYGLVGHSEAAGIYFALRGSEQLALASLQRKVQKQTIVGDWRKDKPADWFTETADFSLFYQLGLAVGESRGFTLVVALADRPGKAEDCAERLARMGPAAAREQTCQHWASVLSPFARASMSDRCLDAALRRCYAYAKMLSVPVGEQRFLISDHVDFVATCPRDCFAQAAALLYFEPEEVAGYLRFLFETAIPQGDLGGFYLASGDSPHRGDGHFLLDLACYPFLTLHRYWRFTSDPHPTRRESIVRGVDRLLEVTEHYRCDKTGLYRSTRRSSDEECLLPLFVPGNMLLACTLEAVAEMTEEAYSDGARATEARRRAAEIRQAIRTHAVKKHETLGVVYAWEVDEHGNYFLYDQADVPNLLTAPYWGFCSVQDPIYRNTVRFAFSQENEGYAETADGWFAALCDGTKTDPDGPWPLGILGELLLCPGSPERRRKIMDWLRHAVSPSLQFPEIVDKHTGGTSSRVWFVWPTALFVVAYLESICGIRVGKTVQIRPAPPAGWDVYESPVVRIRGRQIRVRVEAGSPTVWVDGKEREPGDLGLG